jgi:hypothetical protein
MAPNKNLSDMLDKDATSVTEDGSSQVKFSNATATDEGAAKAAPQPVVSNDAYKATVRELNALKLELASVKQSQNTDSISKLADLIASSMKPAPAPVDTNNTINSTKSLTGMQEVSNVDGRSLIQAQELLQGFRAESKKPITIPRSLATSVGPYLTITVNGVRVSIPCDGQTHYINETHWEHAMERIAKLDSANSDNAPDIKTVS